MKPILIEVGIGTIIAGSFLVAYIKKIKSALRKRILRNSAEGKI